MNTDEHLDRLEKRLTVLEGLVRQIAPLLRGRATDEEPLAAGRQVGRAAPDDSKILADDVAPAEPQVSTAAIAPDINPVEPPPALPPRPPRPSTPKEPSPTIDSEQWFGQRGLLAVGVVFLILAAGYLLKLSFDRGWISPIVRCTGGALAGMVVGAVGWRLTRRGLLTYGAALIGCGAAIVYLTVWAAARLYQFIPPTSATAGLALVSLSLAAIALAINVEALGATAALGAFFAPLLLGSTSSDANILLLYLGVMAVSLGWVAAHRGWRLTMLVVGASYFGLVTSGPYEHANPHALLVYALFGGSAGLYVGLREQWWETRLLSFSGGWSLLGLANDNLPSHWPTLAGAIILAAPVWGRALRSNRIWPSNKETPETTDWSPGESFYFYLTPLLLAWAVYQIAPATFARNEGLLPLMVGIPYLIAGFTARRTRFALVGTTAVMVAALMQWDGLKAPWALLIAALLWPSLDHALRRTDGRWYGLLALAAALGHLLYVDLEARSIVEPAFVGPWAVLMWAVVLALAIFGAGLWHREDASEKSLASILPQICWTAAGVMLLFGVTGEIHRYFGQSTMPQVTANLARGLAISAWWIVFAACLVLLGFRRDLKTVRVAGLAVSAMAVLKVVILDLSTLDALYRVGSVFILGIVALGLAYLYHRRA